MSDDEREFLTRVLEALTLLTPMQIPMELYMKLYAAAERAGLVALSRANP